jgi:GntR family transcriptional regulator / MocR family aminotransferase
MRSEFDLGFAIDRASTLSLQHQLRLRLIEAIHRGVLRPGRKLPSSRQLSEQIGVSRNTVTLAYDALLAEGHLLTRPRSGIFVASEIQGDRLTTGRRGITRKNASAIVLPATPGTTDFQRPPNWDQHPYPYLPGCIDASLVPVDEWREVLRLAFSRQSLVRWNASVGHDDALLVDELRTQVLPFWGIDAGTDEIASTVSARHAFHLATEVLLQRSTSVLLDDSVDAEMRSRVLSRQPLVYSFGSDENLLRSINDALQGSVLIMDAGRVTRGSQDARATAIPFLEAAAARDIVILEIAATPELRESRRGALSLRSFDTSGRVVFVGGLSTMASLGTPPGYVHADARIVDRVRKLRHSIGGELEPGMQRAWSLFIGLGHYAACMARANRLLLARRTVLRDALNHYLHKFVTIESVRGSSAYRVLGPPAMDAAQLARDAAALGVLVEPVGASQPAAFYMGVSGLARESVRAGVQLLATLIRGNAKFGARQLSDEPIAPLAGKDLQRALSGMTLLYNTVYGDPCTINIQSDGVLVGRAGYANEDCDRGRWWIEDGRWFRQWDNWAFGEPTSFTTIVDSEQVRWYNSTGLLVDTALIVRGAPKVRKSKR